MDRTLPCSNLVLHLWESVCLIFLLATQSFSYQLVGMLKAAQCGWILHLGNGVSRYSCFKKTHENLCAACVTSIYGNHWSQARLTIWSSKSVPLERRVHSPLHILPIWRGGNSQSPRLNSRSLILSVCILPL